MTVDKNAYHRSWYEKNKEHARAQNKKWTTNNKEKRNECLRQYRTSLKGRYGEIRKQSKSRNKSFSITFEEFCDAVSKPCFYCEYKFGTPVKSGSGIDRIDNTIGYEPGNIISCCKNCNAIKSDFLSFEETKALINLLLKMRGLIV